MTKKSWLLLIPALVGAFAFVQFERYQQRSLERDQVIVELVQGVLKSSHFSPRDINDDFSKDAFRLYLESLDPNKNFFTQKDIAQLKKYETKVDDEILQKSFTFFDLSQEIFQMRLKEVSSFFHEYLKTPFDYSIDESYITNPDNVDFPEDQAALRDRWRKQLKYRVMIRVYDKLEAQKDSAFEGEAKSFAALEEKAREKELEVFEEWFENYSELEHMDWLGIYVNSMANVFDPHTEYFPPSKQEDFEIQMSGQLEGIGAQLQKKSGYVTVTRIISGSASWRQGDLEEGDKILLVGQGDEEPVDVVGMNINKVVKLIRGKKGTTVVLTVKKRDGSRQEIAIERDVVELESTFARSALIGEDQKTGYIKLPKFYVDFYSKANHNCAEDVKEEIMSLQKNRAERIILDLRNNGGGSLQGVIDMVGLFIKDGPVVQVKTSNNDLSVHDDRDKNIYWDKPLLVMTNEFSASASEIFASAIQDYERGLIFGAKSTYGKGTVQNVWDLDRAVSDRFKQIKPLGAVKLTIQKYYRINGGTPQLKGVTPDISVPGIYDQIPLGESEEEFALAYDQIPPAEYEKWNHENWSKVIKGAEKRMRDIDNFKKIEAYASFMKAERDDAEVTLNYEVYKREQEARAEKLKSYEDIFESENKLSVSFLAGQKEALASDSAKVDEYTKWHKNLAKDLFLHQAVLTAEEM